MKALIKKIIDVVNIRKKMASLKSWSKYLENEVDYLNKKSARDAIAINDLIRENELISGANTQLIKQAAAARNAANRMRDKQMITAATPKEHEFLNVCAAIYDSGKVIKGRTFATMMEAALKERRSASTNRFGGNNEISALWGERVSSKGN
ncbi:hypothetical protein GVT67_11875 [Salmonella enterica]|nr:hypothetical protein [Salmonella enterica]